MGKWHSSWKSFDLINGVKIPEVLGGVGEGLPSHNFLYKALE
jgi:hypothetical protein